MDEEVVALYEYVWLLMRCDGGSEEKESGGGCGGGLGIRLVAIGL
jgi:hypothetical protein